MAVTVGLIAAMHMEARPVLRLLGRGRPFPLPGYRARLLTVAGVDCILVESGIGIEKAYAAARALLAAAAPRYLLSYGVAGAVEKEVGIGDAIVPSQVTLLDRGATGPGLRLAALSAKARAAVKRALETRGAHLFDGTAITTRGPQPTTRELVGWQHPVLDMETAGFGRAAQEHGTPLLSIRTVSDNPDEPFPLPMETFIDSRGNFRPGRMIAAILRRPGVLGKLIGVGRNGQRAAQNAAAAVAAVLEDPLHALEG